MCKQIWIFPEYCAADLFTGWHLYERDRNDGSENDVDGWGWIRGHFKLRHVHELCASLGHALPSPDHARSDYRCDEITTETRFIEAFAAEFPTGLLVWKNDNRSPEYVLVASMTMEECQ